MCLRCTKNQIINNVVCEFGGKEKSYIDNIDCHDNYFDDKLLHGKLVLLIPRS